MQGAQRAAPPAWFVVRERWAASREHPCCSHRAALPPRPDSFQEACHAPRDLASPAVKLYYLASLGVCPSCFSEGGVDGAVGSVFAFCGFLRGCRSNSVSFSPLRPYCIRTPLRRRVKRSPPCLRKSSRSRDACWAWALAADCRRLACLAPSRAAINCVRISARWGSSVRLFSVDEMSLSHPVTVSANDVLGITFSSFLPGVN